MARQAPTQEIVVRPSWVLPGAIALLAILLVLVVVRWAPPAAPAGSSLPGVLAEIAGDGAPHPAGSPAEDAVRQRILALLRRAGYAPEVATTRVCNRGVCARVTNLLARLAGRQPGKAVLVMAHYDSVAAGPGVGDDLSGTAALLEVARELKAEPAPRNEVLFLIDEGEELGLLGARAFAEHHPAAASVGAIVNLDARGASGPSMMFETSGASDGWLVPLFARDAPSPVTSSLFSFIYHQMPNDTDLTVWKSRGVPGLNFAFIGDPQLYHTSHDDLARLSPDTLEHQRSNALAAVRALAGADLSAPPRGEAYWFDLLRLFVVRWGAGIHLALAFLTGALALAVAVLGLRRGTVRPGAFGRGLLALPLIVLATAAAAYGLRILLAGAFPSRWIAHPAPAQAAFSQLALAVSLLLALWFARRASFGGLWLGVWSWWALLAVVLSWLAPGAAYLFQLPALAAALVGWLLIRRPRLEVPHGLALIPMAVAALLWFPPLASLYVGLGVGALPLVSALAALVLAALVPFVAVTSRRMRRGLAVAAWVGAGIATVIAANRPAFSPEAPQGLNLQVHRDADSGKVRFLVRGFPLPAALAKAAPFAPRPELAYPWSPPGAALFAAPGPDLPELAPPQVVVEKDETVGGRRHLILRLVSPRGARAAFLALPASVPVLSATLDGVAVPLPSGLGAGPFVRLIDVTLPPEGTRIELELGSAGHFTAYAADQTSGLPPQARALAAARPAWAVPIQEGDATVVSRKLEL
jgi:hypothetical protein